MPRYFDKFPKVLYTKDGTTNLLTNLLVRVDKIRSFLDNASLFYRYDIQEGDTPEIIASKYYDDPELHWAVLIFNDMSDAFYDWPMTYQQLQDFIIEKYGSVATAKSTIHHYEKIVQSTDSFSGETTKNVYVIDLTSYNALVPSTTTKTFPNGGTVTVDISKRAVDSYDYEDELNESKRNIRLIKRELMPEVKRQFEYLMGR